MSTIEYYNQNADDFFSNTVRVDLSSLYKPFTKLLPEKANVLDAGCGSGRDAMYFSELGYSVTAFDASAELVRKAKEYTGLDVLLMTFSELDKVNTYDGIWACASLLHVPKTELPDTFMRFEKALKSKGVWYLSFKLGQHERTSCGRAFTDLNEEELNKLLKDLPTLSIKQIWITQDARPDRSERWLNALILKS